MKHLKLSFAKVRDSNVPDYDIEEMLALAASLDDCQDFEPGDIVWAKLTGLCSILFCFVCGNLVFELMSYFLEFKCNMPLNNFYYYFCCMNFIHIFLKLIWQITNLYIVSY